MIEKMNKVENEPLKNHTTFQIGGPADEFYEPETFEQLTAVIRNCKSQNKKYFLLGGGSNLVFSDAGFRGAVICTKKLNRIAQIEPGLVKAEAGATMKELIDFCTEKGLSGFEEFAGLPGTVGGALYMNARCFDKSVCESLYETFWLEEKPEGYENESILFSKDENNWDYKKSPFQNSGKIIRGATFKVTPVETKEEKALIKTRCEGYIKSREEKGHFKHPSAGSVFKNNRDFGKPSGKIIDEAGLRGYKIGGAQIAEFHGNFIVNVDNAKADNIKDLVEFAKKTVKDKFGYDLQEEIIFIEEDLK